MRIFLAITIASLLATSAAAQELSPGEIAWGNAAAKCLARVAPDCMVRTDHPQFPGKPKMWCPKNTPQFVQVQKTCDDEADAAVAPNSAGKWQHREVPPQKPKRGYDAS